MSDYLYKIIPDDAALTLSDAILLKTRKYLEEAVDAAEIMIRHHEQIEFIDCGENLETVTCPLCKTMLAFDWWGERMDEAAEKGFSKLDVIVPCCQKRISLNDLVYHSPCGFAAFELDVLDPSNELSQSVIHRVEDILGVNVRVVVCRY